MKLGKLTDRLKPINISRRPMLEAKAGATLRLYGDTWMAIRRAVLQRDAYTCQSCGIVRRDNEIDHRTPLEQGGSNDMSNLWTLCGGTDGCHTRKTKAEAKTRAGIAPKWGGGG